MLKRNRNLLWIIPFLFFLLILGTIRIIDIKNQNKIVQASFFSPYKYQIDTPFYTGSFAKKDSTTTSVNFNVDNSDISIAILDSGYTLNTVSDSMVEYIKGEKKVIYTTSSTGIKEEVIITKKEDANTEYTFSLKNSKLEIIDDIPYFLDNKGVYIFNFSKPFAFDSKGSKTEDVKYEIEDIGNDTYKLKTVVDEKWLNDKKRVFPITVDPSIIYTPTPTPLDTATGVNIPTAFTVTGTDTEGDYLRYKIEVCENREMTYACQTFDQTSSQTGWTGQNTQSNTAYTSGTTGTYTTSNLTSGFTYYWRSYAIDPGGSNTWSTVEATPRSFTTNAKPRPATSYGLTIYSSRRISEQVSTTNGWAALTGSADTGTTASSNGWISSTNLTSGRKYLILATGSHSTDSTSGRSGLKVTHGSSSFENSESVDITQNATASYKTPYFWFTVWTAVNGESLEVQQFWNGTGSQARAEDITLLAIDVTDLIISGDLQYSENKTYTNLTTSFADTTTLTFTPSNNNDSWWIMGYNQTSLNNGGASSTFANQIYLNSVAYSNNLVTVNANNIGPIYPLGYIAQLANSSNSMSIQAKEAVSDQIVTASGIFALRLNAFEDFAASVKSTGPSMTSSGTWVNHATSYAYNSLASSNWIVMAGGSVNDSGTRVMGRIRSSDVSITDDVGGWNKASGDKTPLILGDYLMSLTAGSKSITFDAETTLAGTSTLNYPWLVAFTRELTPNYPTQDSPTNGNVSVAVRPQIKVTAIDPESSYLRYKIKLCTDLAMTTGCQTFDQTSSQTGWSGQNTQSNTAYTSGTQATYTLQSDLSGTYYWQAFAIDPAGTNTFTPTKTTPHSFTVTTAPTAPTSLLTEGSTDPTGVSDTTPEFTAIHNDPEGDSSASYQIQVNTQSDFLGTSKWDSGKTSLVVLNGARSTDISYAGSSLGYAGSTYYWRIKFWDSNDTEGSWSSTAQFTMLDQEYSSSCYLVQSHDDTSITIKWKDNSSTEDGFLIERKVDAGSFSTLTTKAANTITHTDSTISQGHTYQYRIAPTKDSVTGTWCTTEVASVYSGSIQFGGLKLEGIKID